MLQKKFFFKKLYEKWGLETCFRPFFSFQGILCKKESEVVCMLTWKDFDSFAITYPVEVACFKNFIFRKTKILIS